LKQAVAREAERLGVKFIVLDENFELAGGAPLYETPQFAAAVEGIVCRCLAKGDSRSFSRRPAPPDPWPSRPLKFPGFGIF
jgi:hypothetical protein